MMEFLGVLCTGGAKTLVRYFTIKSGRRQQWRRSTPDFLGVNNTTLWRSLVHSLYIYIFTKLYYIYILQLGDNWLWILSLLMLTVMTHVRRNGIFYIRCMNAHCRVKFPCTYILDKCLNMTTRNWCNCCIMEETNYNQYSYVYQLNPC